MKPNQHKVTLAEAIDIILNQEGKMMSVEFIKRTNGEVREMNCRTGVRKHLSGEGSKYSFKDNDLISVFDLQKNGYRTINARAITKVRAGGREYIVKK
jgi:hypothetical protein